MLERRCNVCRAGEVTLPCELKPQKMVVERNITIGGAERGMRLRREQLLWTLGKEDCIYKIIYTKGFKSEIVEALSRT